MNTQEDNNCLLESGNRRLYSSPKLIVYGPLRMLTLNRSRGSNPADGATSGNIRC